MELTLNQAMVDWVTLTRDGRIGQDGYAGNVLYACGLDKQALVEHGKDVYLKNGGGHYHGQIAQAKNGTVGLYNHTLENRSMMTITSALAHEVMPQWLPAVQDYWRVTRIDTQVTIPISKRFDAIALASMFDEKRSVSMLSSTNTKRDGKTVYIGSKKSDRWGEVYEKKKGELLRLEVRSQAGYAAPIAFELTTTRYHEEVLWGVLSNWASALPMPGRDAIVKKFGIGDYRIKSLARVDESAKKAEWQKMAMSSIENTVLNGEYPAAELVESMERLLSQLYRGNVNHG